MKKFVLFFFFAIAVFVANTSSAQVATTSGATNPYEFTIHHFGLKFTLPNDNWRIVATETWFEIYHTQLQDVLVTINPTYSPFTSAVDAANDEKAYIKQMLPGAVYLVDNQNIPLGNTQGVTFTYKNPSTLLISRSVLFINNNKSWHVKFEFNESSLNTIKDDLASILRNMTLIGMQNIGGEVHNKNLGARIKAPTSFWRVQNYTNLIRVSYVQASDNIIQANADIMACTDQASTLEQAYASNSGITKRDNPNLQVLKENQTVTLGGKVPGIFHVYRDAAKGVVNKDIYYIHNGNCRLLQFSFLEKSFELLKNEFTKIQDNIVFD